MTTPSELLNTLKSRGAHIATPAPAQQISLINATLREHRNAMLPKYMIDLYTLTGGINLGSGYIFGPTDIIHAKTFVTPGIVQVNNEVLSHSNGMTIFGRNDLFWFSFDAFGSFYILDNLTLKPLKKYDDPARAITDCLIGGKF